MTWQEPLVRAEDVEHPPERIADMTRHLEIGMMSALASSNANGRQVLKLLGLTFPEKSAETSTESEPTEASQ